MSIVQSENRKEVPTPSFWCVGPIQDNVFILGLVLKDTSLDLEKENPYFLHSNIHWVTRCDGFWNQAGFGSKTEVGNLVKVIAVSLHLVLYAWTVA